MEKKQIFISHTKHDAQLCDLIDKLFARSSLGAFRSEYENIKKPEWKTIRNAMNKSKALFFLIGPRLMGNQNRYTLNWIAYEIGLACQLGIDVRAIVDARFIINFPMPYVNNYFPLRLIPRTRIDNAWGIKNDPNYSLLFSIIKRYEIDNTFPFSIRDDLSDFRVIISCNHCGSQFNYYRVHNIPGLSIKCPQCLKAIRQRIEWIKMK